MMVPGICRILLSGLWVSSSLFGGEKRVTAGGNGESGRRSIERLLRRRRCLGGGPRFDPDACEVVDSSRVIGEVGLPWASAECPGSGKASGEPTTSTAGIEMTGVFFFFGEVVNSRSSLSRELEMVRGGVDGLEDGGDGGSGVRGECQDWTVWKGSVEEVPDELPPAVRDFDAVDVADLNGVTDLVGVADLLGVADLVDWASLDLYGVGLATGGFAGELYERPASIRLIRFLVKFTGAT